jgi:hypothetical protein
VIALRVGAELTVPEVATSLCQPCAGLCNLPGLFEAPDVAAFDAVP